MSQAIMDRALWYLGRGIGVSALVLLTVVLTLGIVVRSGQPLPGLPRFAVAAVHRTASLSAVLFVALHIVTLTLDPYSQLRIVDAVFPFMGRYRPFWQGLGTLAFELVVILIVTSLLRHRLGLRTWKAVHWSAYGCWPLAIAHALGNGTDRQSLWMLITLGCCLLAVASTLAWRLMSHTFQPDPVMNPISIPADLAGLR